MSASAHALTVPSRFVRADPRRHAEPSAAARAWLRAGAFAALALYATERWSRLLTAPPLARLLGLIVLSVAIAAGVPILRRTLGGPPAAVGTFALGLLALPISGLPWQDLVHLRLALGERHVAAGLSGLPSALLPYSGPGRWVPTVIVLGAAVLLLDAAVVLAWSPRVVGDLRRAGAALPLVALAVVPSTLVRPEFPYLQGVVLFGLLAVFLWGERLRRRTPGTALILCTIAAVGASALAPRLDIRHALVDYRAWAGTPAHARVDSFVWNQTYGPLHWPRRGRVVLTVQARTGDYWKAVNLDVFDGTAWISQATGGAPLPAPALAAVATWSQLIKVTIGGMRTHDVIASGYAYPPTGVTGGDAAGASDGTWSALRTLAPGARYVVDTYSPHPSAIQLRTTGRAYPDRLLAPYRSIRLPVPGVLRAAEPEITFAPYYGRHHGPAVTAAAGLGDINAARATGASPYGPVYRLARRLAAGTHTPYALVMRIKAYLDVHMTYDESPPVRRYPLAAFLLRDHVGYCQQFSGAMALLLRMDGVPARVATGFTTGARQGRGGAFQVSDLDAHAWDEVWYPGYGWVTVDPTPAAAPALGGKTSLPIDKSQIVGHAGASSAPRRDPLSTGGAGPAPHPGTGGGIAAGAIAVIVAGLALVAAVALVARPRADDLESRLAELERALQRTGRPLRAGVTLTEIEQRFHSTPEAAAYIRALRLARYRPAGGGATPPGARRALRRELASGLGLSGRLRALWALPPSR